MSKTKSYKNIQAAFNAEADITRKIGDHVFVAYFSFDRASNLKTAEVRELVIQSIYPDYCNRLGLHYGACRPQYAHIPMSGLAYRPERLHDTELEARNELRVAIKTRIDQLTKALALA